MTNSDFTMPLILPISIFVMALSPLPAIGHHLAQTFQQIFHGESRGASAGGEFARHLRELALALGIVFLWFLFRHKGPGALVSLQHAAEFELTISAQHGVWVDGQIHSQLPDRG